MEKKFVLSQDRLQVSCQHSAPDHCQVRRIVLGVHGLAGNANDAIQTAIAEEMAMFYAATFRFDFPGHGESPCDDFTVENCVASLLAVAAEARSQYPEVADLCIFATGFGAYVTLLCLPQLLEMPGNVKLVVQTPSVMMHQTLLSMLNLSKETFRVMEQVTLPLPRPLILTYRFYQELEQHLALSVQPIPILILHGEEDDYIPMEDIQHFRQINELSRLVVIPGTTHQFQEDGAWDMVLDLTRDWFEYEQVLLTDWE